MTKEEQVFWSEDPKGQIVKFENDICEKRLKELADIDTSELGDGSFYVEAFGLVATALHVEVLKFEDPNFLPHKKERITMKTTDRWGMGRRDRTLEKEGIDISTKPLARRIKLWKRYLDNNYFSNTRESQRIIKTEVVSVLDGSDSWAAKLNVGETVYLVLSKGGK